MGFLQVIVDGRGSGKTRRAIERAAGVGAYLVVRDHGRAVGVIRMAEKMGLGNRLPFPLTFDEFVRRDFYGRGIRAFVIDDVDDLVRWIASGVPWR